MNLGIWTIEYTLPPREGRNWARNGTVTVVAPTLPRAIELALLEYPLATVHAAHKRGQGKVVFDPNVNVHE